MVEPLPCPDGLGPERCSTAAASEHITEQLGRLIPLVNGSGRVARIDSRAALSGLPSLLSWDADGQLTID